MADFTVGKYLAARFEQIGLKHYFMVPGDYNLVLLDELLTNENLEQIGCCNELNAAYAAEGRIDLVDVFRASQYVPEIVKDVMRLKIPYLWLQEGVCHEEAVKWAEADGVLVVMDRCIYKEHARLDRVSQ